MTLTPMSEDKPRMIIVGTGWAGFYIAQYVETAKYAVTIVSPRRTSAYTPLLASAATGQFGFSLAEEPVRSKSRSAVKYVKANVVDINFKSKTVNCAPAFEEDPDISQQEFYLQYDILVLAPGCVPNTFGTPGVSEHAIFMKSVSDAMAVRKLLFDLLEKASLPNASESQIHSLLHIAIVGGGPTGIELTAELDDLAKRELRDIYPEVAHRIHISVYDVAPHILSAYDSKLFGYANESLTRRGVAIETNSTIERVDREALYIKSKGRIPYGMLIWATGNKNVPLIEKLEARKTPKGLKRILTDHYLRVLKPEDSKADNSDEEGQDIYPDVFALGDAADIYDATLPTTAEVAVQKAKYLVNLFNRTTDPHSPVSGAQPAPFIYQQKALVSYLGQHDGVIQGRKGKNGEADGEGWTGRSAWLAWRSGSLMWTRGWRNRTLILLTWVINWLGGKEVARM